MLLAHISTWMVKRRLGKIAYCFTGFPALSCSGDYGIYVNIPFCHSRCTFCPFYKELYREDLKNRYVAALAEEIKTAEISGTPWFVYFGGGTPNVLSPEDLSAIVGALREKITIRDMGIELSPALAHAGLHPRSAQPWLFQDKHRHPEFFHSSHPRGMPQRQPLRAYQGAGVLRPGRRFAGKHRSFVWSAGTKPGHHTA